MLKQRMAAMRLCSGSDKKCIFASCSSSSSANFAEEKLDSISAAKRVKQWPLLTSIKSCIG